MQDMAESVEPDRDRPPEDEPDLTDEEIVDHTRWMCEHNPEFFAGYTLDNLEPDKYPEHRVIAEFIRTRDRLQPLIDPEKN
jgi:hypothetical protein